MVMMTAYRRVYGFGYLRADCQGPVSAPDPYARFEYRTTFTFLPWEKFRHKFTFWYAVYFMPAALRFIAFLPKTTVSYVCIIQSSGELGFRSTCQFTTLTECCSK